HPNNLQLTTRNSAFNSPPPESSKPSKIRIVNPHEISTLLSDGAPPDPKAHGPFAALRRALPSGDVIRFLMVGVFNTAFSLALYSAFVILFSRLLPSRGKP